MHYSLLFRQLREKSKLSVVALAEKAGVNRNTVLNVESGRRVRVRTLAHLIAHLGDNITSAEANAVLLAWVEAESGVAITKASVTRAQDKIVKYSRSTAEATGELVEAIRTGRLKEADIRMLSLVATTPAVLSIVRSICDLLPQADEDLSELKVAEDR
jgi:transcriptional regulator with XRE-family HTH domain